MCVFIRPWARLARFWKCMRMVTCAWRLEDKHGLLTLRASRLSLSRWMPIWWLLRIQANQEVSWEQLHSHSSRRLFKCTTTLMLFFSLFFFLVLQFDMNALLFFYSECTQLLILVFIIIFGMMNKKKPCLCIPFSPISAPTLWRWMAGWPDDFVLPKPSLYNFIPHCFSCQANSLFLSHMRQGAEDIWAKCRPLVHGDILTHLTICSAFGLRKGNLFFFFFLSIHIC